MKLKIGPLTMLLAFIAFGSNGAPANPTPLLHAHAHNDYEHARPLFDALDHGFCSVEADIYLVDGLLLVAHDRDKVSPTRTLQALYLDPLRERVQKNGGKVFPDGSEVTLLIDVKTEAESTYAALRKVLDQYAGILTTFEANTIHTNAITVILSGNRPQTTLAAEKFRRAAIDGRLSDLDGTTPVNLIPLISDNWTKHFKWRGQGPIPADEKDKLKALVERAHQQGRRVRFWGTMDVPEFWRELRRAGVDLLNTDDLAGVQRFFQTEPQQTKVPSH
jgi:glycerophosphoryl diester phosphodiesterase